jgi:hypothetical protein
VGSKEAKTMTKIPGLVKPSIEYMDSYVAVELKKQYFTLNSFSEKESFDLVSESDLYIDYLSVLKRR